MSKNGLVLQARLDIPRSLSSWAQGHFAQALPRQFEAWQPADSEDGTVHDVHQLLRNTPWSWPQRPVLFISDPHADAQAFVASLIASGGVRPTKNGFALTELGRRSVFVIGGDCLDKGPSNLELLNALKRLFDTGADVKLLAGNHDLRLMIGLRALNRNAERCCEHLFLRMGPKAVPLLREVYDHYVDAKQLAALPDEAECRARLMPRDDWEQCFSTQAGKLLSPAALEKELAGIRRKRSEFLERCKEAGLDMRQVYAAARTCQQHFLDPTGDYAWFFARMQLAWHSGSFLFLHAGVDDVFVDMLTEQGLEGLNARYQEACHGDLFGFYHGPLANALRTKYREQDHPLTANGLVKLHAAGIHAVVHGHRSSAEGQRIMLRQGLLHFEGDVTLNRNSRASKGLAGVGIGCTIISPQGHLLGISRDHPRAKLFAPELIPS